MSGFSADWLRLREPFDHAARQGLAAALHLPASLARWRSRSPGEALPVIDLACGHGANLRALAPLLGGVQHWHLVDHDPVLLAAVPGALAEWAQAQGYGFLSDGGEWAGRVSAIAGPNFHATVVCERLDLARDLGRLAFGEAPLVTASALLDLVSAPWLQALIDQARAAQAAMLWGLTVDDRTAWAPADPDDALVQGLFTQHQGRDKGFGPALGPRAAEHALQQLALAGFDTQHTQTDWGIDGAVAPQMLRAMLEGLAAAAIEQAPTAQDAVRAWQARRSAALGATRLRVGHVDILATPA